MTAINDDLAVLEPLDEQLDHVREEAEAAVVNEYGDYECPYSRQAFRAIEPIERELGVASASPSATSR